MCTHTNTKDYTTAHLATHLEYINLLGLWLQKVDFEYQEGWKGEINSTLSIMANFVW